MKCSLCGFEFAEKNGRSLCDKCRFIKTCELIKCPNCGFDIAVEPKWIKKLKNKKRNKK